ncbi:uncharacterized protein LOC128745211 [Sabethes cyaneus]|uniref:uncharacterized protein LOC128745211 n=1 Tax=Sabethes cyaneus TaxID=53552 RepID=UPI00237E378E|nr:uncharacterized protein LOC128745211 [Sabethes cyaneus]
MAYSHLIEKFKVGKRFVLLDLVIKPDCEEPWEWSGPENKFLNRDDWKLIYQHLDTICKNHFGDNGKKPTDQCTFDKEYELRMKEKPNILIRYEVKGQNERDNLNSIFHESERKLHKDCFSVLIADDTREIYRQLDENKKTIERLRKENEKLKTLPESSQEYTPSPISNTAKQSRSTDNHSEYVPTSLNGSFSPHKSRYKPTKIADACKAEPDPYTPSSSQENDVQAALYVPSIYTTPNKTEREVKITVSSSTENESRAKRSRRCRTKEIFGHSDDDVEETSPLSPAKVKEEANNSVEDIFSQDSPSKAVDVIGSSSDEIPKSDEGKRTVLPRKTKCSAQKEPETSNHGSKRVVNTPANLKRRRKESGNRVESTSKSTKFASNEHTTSGKIDGWLLKEPANPSTSSATSKHSSAKNKKNDGPSKSSIRKNELVVPILRQPVDLEKLRAEEESMRKTLANLDKLDKMLPEDKSQLDVPILNCFQLSVADIQDTFPEYEYELRKIFDRYKDQSERQWQLAGELCYFTEVTSVLDEDQKYAMLTRLEKEFVPPENCGMYTEFFTSTLIMEWGLRVWMKLFNYTNRKEALDRIRLQEEANPIELSSSYLASLTCSGKKRR